MSALTALTAQNTLGVKEVHPVPATFVATQMTEVLGDLGADVVKSGMLFDAEIVRTLARQLDVSGLPSVVDPVMIAKGGAPLLQPEAVSALREELLPRTYLLTPNIPEAEALTGMRIADPAAMEEAASRLCEMGARNVLVKGGHLAGEAIDVLLTGGVVQRFAAPRIETAHTHGTGCTYAAAIATFLAQGLPLQQAVARAKKFVHEAISAAVGLGHGHGPVNHWAAARKTLNPSDL
jgi:hydroxymethylpyrimidine kinase/phosphomethylpyrimidine kinase/thiamine-phosphate diphosphorylase